MSIIHPFWSNYDYYRHLHPNFRHFGGIECILVILDIIGIVWYFRGVFVYFGFGDF